MGKKNKKKDKQDTKRSKIEKIRCITPRFRVSYPSVFKAKAFEGQEAKFTVTMLFKKDTDLSKLRKAIKNAAIEKWGKDESDWPKLRMPLRNGDKKKDREGFKGHIFCVAKSKTKPGLIDENREEILDEKVFYAGCYARAEILAYAYDQNGNKGVGLSLQNLMKVADGKPFSGRKDAQTVFKDVEDEDDGSDDESNYDDDDEDSDDDDFDAEGDSDDDSEDDDDDDSEDDSDDSDEDEDDDGDDSDDDDSDDDDEEAEARRRRKKKKLKNKKKKRKAA